MNWNLEFQTRSKEVKIPEKKVAMIKSPCICVLAKTIM